MTIIRALVAEDEAILSLTLIKMLEKLWPTLQICSAAENGVVAVQEALTHLPDILFLDSRDETLVRRYKNARQDRAGSGAGARRRMAG